MPESNLSLLGRLSVAIGSFFAILGNGKLAAEVRDLRNGVTPAAAPVAPAAPQPAPAKPQARPPSRRSRHRRP
ncbi:hypothetical protein DM48_630 [Burkholderia gladioli]|uniref:Uncharacterized protein n=1 Tax=Burkholderia gladioli TaxID=28095 RepID=A0AAW3EXI9_BURGA|nr:hypothetical protein DM48_630 [Burkholderia gladioli]